MTDTPAVKTVENTAHSHLRALLALLKTDMEKLGLKIEDELKKL